MERPTTLLRAIVAACGPDLVHKKIRAGIPEGAHRTWGCCYVASEALYHLWGKDNGFRLHFLHFSPDSGHFYLMDRDGNVLDPTRRQFYGSGIKLEYRKGKCCGFLTRQPSKRCQTLLGRIKLPDEALA